MEHKKRKAQKPPELFKHEVGNSPKDMNYFIPEWDDRVNPNYDFQSDIITPDRDPYSDDQYAHELYGTPNYDGILVSKSVIDSNKKRKKRIEETGIHAHLRVPRNFPVMGDCGAFSYIDMETPPYESAETVDFYQNLDFDFGVSVDHLIIPSHLQGDTFALVRPDGQERSLSQEEFEVLQKTGLDVSEKQPTSRDLFEDEDRLYTWKVKDLTEAKRRWDITLENSESFINYHRKSKAKFTPIAGCQGWDSESQAEMFRLQQSMGYDYIALGGLVRSKTAEIIESLQCISKLRRPSTKIHLFGVARPEAILEFQKLGVNSIDSARFLRQAWLSATSNYYSGIPSEYAAMLKNSSTTNADLPNNADWRYTAIRVPPIRRGGGDTLTAKAKKKVDSGHDLSDLLMQEKSVLDTLHEFERRELSVEVTLERVVQYDQLMGGDPRNAELYYKLLIDRPWEKCPCSVCQNTGIDVVIFRRNNRNRRRGFHNTWWFYQLFGELLK